MTSGTASMPLKANYMNRSYSSTGRKHKVRSAVCYASDRVEKIYSIDLSLVFCTPIVFGYRIEDGFYCADYNAGGLTIASAEPSLDEMIADMKSQFKHAWDYYALESDDRLSEKAKKVKSWFTLNVRSA